MIQTLLQVRFTPVPFIVHGNRGGGGCYDPEKIKVLMGIIIFFSALYVLSLAWSIVTYHKRQTGYEWDKPESFFSYHFYIGHPVALISMFNCLMVAVYLMYIVYLIGKLIGTTFL